MQAKASNITTKYLVRVGVLGAVSAVLYYGPQIPIIPPIYKLDFSAIPILLGGFSMGPAYALLIALIKDLTGLLHSSSWGVGELADFLMTGGFAFVASLIYKNNRTFKGALTGMLAGIGAIMVLGALSNYFILIPFYVTVMGFTTEKIIGMVASTVPAVDNMFKLILFAVLPFNLLKGVVMCLVTLLVYKRLSPLLHVR